MKHLPASGSRLLKAIKFAWVDARRDKAQQRLLLVGAVMALVLLVVLARSVREAGQTQAVVPSDIRGHPLVLPLRDLLNEVDVAALSVRQQWRQTGSLPPPDELARHSADLHGLVERVDILGADGRLVASSRPLPAVPVYLGGEEGIHFHRASPRDRIFITRDPASPDSPLIPLRFTRAITDQDGAFQGMVVLSLDASYLRQKLFQRLLAPGEAAALLNPAGRPLLMSPSGVAPSGAALGPLAPAHRPTPFSDPTWQETTLEDLPVRLAILTTPTPSPEAQPLRWLESAVWATLLITLMAGLAHITRLLRDRNALMGALEARRCLADASSQLKSDWVSSVSHEVRTPLNGIMGFAELVGQARSLGEAQEHARVIRASAQHLNEIVSTLLDLSKLEAGHLTLHPERVHLRDMVEDVFALHRVTARQKKLDTQLQIAPDAPDHIVTDRTRLTQVLHNLLHNAVKFTDEGTVGCEIGHDGTRWHFTVRDTGIGMDEDQRAQLFERFNNIPLDTAHHAMQGAGLGMALAREVITLLGGDIRIDSRKGHGTRVHLTLPDLPQEPRQLQTPPANGSGPAAAASTSCD